MEFALILPIFVLLLVGLFDVGRLVFAYSTVNNAAREGGRLAIVDQMPADVQDRAAARAVSLGIPPADILVDFRTTAAPETPGSCSSSVGQDAIVLCTAVVQVPYTYTPATPIIGNLVGTITVWGEARFPVEFNCTVPARPQCPVGQ